MKASILFLLVAGSCLAQIQKRDCDPKFWKDGSVSINGVPKTCDPVTGRWIDDRASIQAIEQMHEEEDALYRAMRVRVLTPKEEQDAAAYGDGLHQPCMRVIGFCTYSLEEQRAYKKELDDAWYQQRRLQMLRKEGCNSK